MKVVIEVSEFLYKQILKRHVSSKTIAEIFKDARIIEADKESKE